ncbi:het-s domain containing protein [Fusarium agapanthi]|uniref:Het-s domain containing protein n=1 Tax=Fusarium agapanthi TaxID=1803897 RepID=A0A9P5B435_9HYPO|nr:het-s domain containing protein [Fusarium agapanthi]
MAELALGVLGIAGTVDVCIKLGKVLVQAYKDNGQADIAINELSVCIQICWSRLASQLEIMKDLELGMARDQRELQSQTLRILPSELEAVTLSISKQDKYTNSKRIKAIQFLGLRETLENTVADLESWQKRFEPTWFQMVKFGPPDLDRALKKASQSKAQHHAQPVLEGLRLRQAFNNSEPIKLAERVLLGLERKAIPYCKAELAVKKEKKHLVIENVSRDTVGWRDARELASRLRGSNPFTFGILQCKGVVQSSTDPSLKFIFAVPEGYSKVQSCRQLLLSGNVPGSLTTRLQIARQLVTAVYYVHLYEFVHKNITPEIVLILEQPERPTDIVVCLIGFQLFRYVEGPTNTSQADPKDSVYQHHPSRMSTSKVNFIMQHDVYSLGVCHLEIGLWKSLVDYESGVAQVSNTLQATGGTSNHLEPEAVKDKLISLSRNQLRALMGDIYSKVVETCLTSLDQGNTEFGNFEDFEGQDCDNIGSRHLFVLQNMVAQTLIPTSVTEKSFGLPAHRNMDEAVSDIVRDYKLVTQQEGTFTIHVHDDPDAPPSSPQRKEVWKKKCNIGRGGQGEVLLQTCVTGGRHYSDRAVKKIWLQRSNSCSKRRYQRELAAIFKFSHERYSKYFVKSLGWYASSTKLYIAMEYLPVGDLYAYVHERCILTEEECRQVICQVLSGLALMHPEGYAHRDIKPHASLATPFQFLQH